MSFDIHIPKPEKCILSWDGPDAEMGVSGWYRFVLRNRDGSVARDTGWFKNIITNVGMARIVSLDTQQGKWFGKLIIGNGTGTPTVTDTALFGTQLGPSQTAVANSSGWGAANAYFFFRQTFRWNEGVGTGTIKEVAAVNEFFGTTFFSHALLVDSGGSPTTIVKGADQSLDVFYELRNYPQAADASGTFDLSGTSYNYTIRALRIGTTAIGTNAREIFIGSYVNFSAYTGGGLGARTDIVPTGVFLYPSLYYDASHSANTGPYGNSVDHVLGIYSTDNQMQAGIDAWHGTITVVTYNTGNSFYQCLYDKTVGGGGIVKTDEDRLRLKLRLKVVRH